MKKLFYSTILFMASAAIVHAQTWTQLGSDIDGEAANDQSGEVIALSGDGSTVIIGAHDNDGNGTSAGHARVFEWNGSNWTQKGSDIDGEADPLNIGYFFGYDVDISDNGNTVVIGAPRNDNDYGNAGQVKVFQWTGSWSPKGDPMNGDTVGNWAGASVSISSNGNTVAYGMMNYGSIFAGDAYGAVRVYTWTGVSWQEKGDILIGENPGDRAHIVSLSANGNSVAIGSKYNSGGGMEAGHVRVYKWSGSAWQQVGSDIDGEAAEDESGSAVAISDDGNTVVIGSPRNGGNGNLSGQVRVYTWTGTTWQQKGTDLNGEGASHYFGTSVCISPDGNTIAVGAESGGDFGRGSTHIYNWNGTAWTQVGNTIQGENDSDKSGSAVSLSDAGDRIAIGAPNNDDAGSFAGHVRVFELEPTSVEEYSAVRNLSIYPNPASDFIKLKFNNSESTKLSVYNALGALVYAEMLPAGNISKDLDISTWLGGVYWIELRDKDGKTVSKLILSK